MHRLFSFSEALVIDIMAFLTLKDISSAQAAAVGKAAVSEVEKIIPRCGKPRYDTIEDEDMKVIVWSYSSTGRLSYEPVHKSKLCDYPSDYFQVLDYVSFAIRLYEALETVREVRIRSGK
ncbi:MAG: hypothetical protein AB7U59_12780 [Desulfovibrionaceae bacterium]